ncbi:MAG TPA: hypothetical protein VG734_16735 [Lacunisphaera sp.]|nr:hypothetical protein [Lacunisphaera sp.]
MSWRITLLHLVGLAAILHAEVRITPSETDRAIATFNTPHCVYPLPAGATNDRHELLLWIPGTQPPGKENPGPGAAGRFCEVATTLGYRAIVLKYPNDESAAVVRSDRDADAFEKFRMTIIAGGKSPHLEVPRAESIENRLVKLLAYLRTHRPTEGWEQFLTASGDIRWEAIALAGQSQGGGHAALLGITHRVARVICFGAPKDNSLAFGKPAAWLRAEPLTPRGRFFALNHQQDHQGCSPAEQMENLRALKLDTLGAPVAVDAELPPYHHSHILTTNYPGGKVASKEAHTTAISPRNEAVFGPTWIYLLTEKVP